LFIYKNSLSIKRKINKLNIDKLNYIVFVKKYLPRLTIGIILLSVTTNSIFASTYNTDEYAKHSLLPTIIPSNEMEWSELIEEKAPEKIKPEVTSYLEEQGALQESFIKTPFKEEEKKEADISPDSSSLVLINPEDTGLIVQEDDSRSEMIEYIVQPGDVLGTIAEKFNLTVSTILWENSLTWNSTIRPGQKLKILPDSGINHEVKSGDTVLAIAKKYQTDAEKIINVNKLADAGDIKIGDLLFIPDGIKPTRVISSYKPKAVTYEPAVDTGSSKLLWPTLSHRITQYYHWRHHGLDIGDKTGNPIYAAESGKVERSGWSRGYGYNVVINHGNGIKTVYAHASKLLVSKGESVIRGQTIAAIGNTGWSTGPHLHFEVRVNGVKQNPLNYIR